jgi:predicted permease
VLDGQPLHALNVAVVELPLQLGETLRQLGQAAIPVALIVLGMQLATTRLAVGAYELAATGLRLLVAPLMAYLVAQGLALAPLDTQVLVLQSGMPVAVNSVVLVSEFGGDPSEVARIVALSTLVSPLTLTLAFALASTHPLGGFG